MIISISGKISSGKDITGKIIQAILFNELINTEKRIKLSISEMINGEIYLHQGWKIKKFADKLKDIVCLLIGCTREQLENREFRDIPLGEEWNKLRVRYSDGYDEVEEIFPLDFDFSTLLDAKGRQAYIHSKEIIQLTPRILLQLLGTEAGRNIIHPDIWVNSLMSEYKEESYNITKKEDYKYENGKSNLDYSGKRFPNWIITDNRFPNETKRVKKEGGVTIKIERDFNLRHPGYNNLEEVKQKDIELYKQLTHYSEIALDDYKDFDYIIYNNGTLEDLIEKVKQILIKENII